ncbi:MAG: ATP-binding protein [Flavobacteriales bacterium]|nr:ATP-binding protein [Flavobacteriales bacterium]
MDISELQDRIAFLEKENRLLREGFTAIISQGKTVSVPDQFQAVFEDAEKIVALYFEELKADPTQGTIEINDERYVLMRASSLSVDFLTKIQSLYADKGEEEAFVIGRNFLFDIAHVIGLEDAKNFHQRMNVEDPIAKLSAGPIHFAYSGWAYVDILPESSPTPDTNFYLKYHHPYSFEADSWIKSGQQTDKTVCIMNAGYSSGWCEESFGIPLTAVEISCRARGDENCTFIMAHPDKINEYIKSESSLGDKNYEVPLFFERQEAEEKIKQSLHEKNILLKEVHHRVKNNLQIISSLLNLQSNYISDESASFLFKETQNRIKTLALVHEKLYKSEDVQYVDLKQYVKSIVELLSYSYNKEYIDVEYEFDDEQISRFDIDRAIPCGLIVNEIVSNAYKHAFPKIYQGRIEVSVLCRDDQFHILIKDNGVGLAEHVNLETPATLGLELVYSLVGQLNGTMEIKTDQGMLFDIRFPVEELH